MKINYQCFHNLVHINKIILTKDLDRKKDMYYFSETWFCVHEHL